MSLSYQEGMCLKGSLVKIFVDVIIPAPAQQQGTQGYTCNVDGREDALAASAKERREARGTESILILLCKLTSALNSDG